MKLTLACPESRLSNMILVAPFVGEYGLSTWFGEKSRFNLDMSDTIKRS